MKKIIVINGPAGVGKDTFIELCRQALIDAGVPVFSFSSVDEVKELALSFGWDGIKDEKGRKLLSDIKFASVSYNDGPTKYLLRRIGETESGLVFLHIREPGEIEKLKHVYPDAVTMHMERANTEIYTNISDQSTVAYKYDYYLANNSDLAHLAELARQFCQGIWESTGEDHEFKPELR